MPFEIGGRISLDGSGLSRTLRGIRTQVAGWSTDIKGMIADAFSARSLLHLAKRTVDYASKIDGLNKSTGMSVKRLQEWDYAAKQNESSIEAIAKGFRGLSKARAEALGGDQGKLAAFGDLGLDRVTLQALSLEEAFSKIARVFQTTDFGADEIALVEQVLGKGAMELLPAFKAGLAESADEADRLGIALDEGAIQSLDHLDDMLKRFEAQMRGPVAMALMGTVSIIGGIVDHIARGYQLIGSIGSVAEALVKRDWNLFRVSMKQSKKALKNFVHFSGGEGDSEAPGPAGDGEREFRARTFVPRAIGGRERAVRESAESFVRDDLARVGGFTGGAGRTESLLERTANAAEDIAKNTDAIARGDESL
jgi:hypothetical protein